MIRLTTKVQVPKVTHPVPVGDRLFGIGSCFVENIGAEFRRHFYPMTTNPMGTVYHPLAMAEQLRRLLDDNVPLAQEVAAVNGVYVHDFFHGDFSDLDPETALANMVAAHTTAREKIAKSSTIILTLGTAFGYRRSDTNQIVANCHKRPGDEFDRQLVYAIDLVAALLPVIDRLHDLDKKVILTVSPVRHVRDSLVDNQISKAQLVTACHLIRQERRQVEYFPAFEILLDELRDYRFYGDDLTHPSPLARRIIFSRFVDWVFAGKAEELMAETSAMIRRLDHRSLRPESDAAQLFNEQTEQMRIQLALRFPFLHLGRP